MAQRQLDKEAVFHAARQIPKPEARSDYLDQICAGDMNLRRRVEALLQVHEQNDDFLKSADEPAPTVDRPVIRWGDAIDLCPHALYMQLTGKSPEDIFPNLRKAAVNA